MKSKHEKKLQTTTECDITILPQFLNSVSDLL